MDSVIVKTPLNTLSRLILAGTVAVGLAAVVSAAPTNVAALGRAPVKSGMAMRTLNAAPGLVVTRAYGPQDEDCFAVSTADGSSRSALVCER